MVKLKEDRISKEDIEEYLSQYSDFSFEIKVLQKLTELNFNCEHSGTFEDPITHKTRQFDIRASTSNRLSDGIIYRFCMAVECKNLRNNFPLVVHCLPRSDIESYQHLIYSVYPKNFLQPILTYGTMLQLYEESIYKPGEYVGKSCDQVGRKASQNHEIIGSDSDVFEKISQSINSTYDIVRENHYIGNEFNSIVSFVLPVLVVPNNSIWAIYYDTNGNIVGGPELIQNIPYFINKSWKVGRSNQQVGIANEKIEEYFLSHLEIVQIDSLEDLINKHHNNDRFSLHNIIKYLKLYV